MIQNLDSRCYSTAELCILFDEHAFWSCTTETLQTCSNLNMVSLRGFCFQLCDLRHLLLPWDFCASGMESSHCCGRKENILTEISSFHQPTTSFCPPNAQIHQGMMSSLLASFPTSSPYLLDLSLLPLSFPQLHPSHLPDCGMHPWNAN